MTNGYQNLETSIERRNLAEASTNGLHVRIDRSEEDGTLLVFIDTPRVPEDRIGPLVRVYLNEECLFENPPYTRREDEPTISFSSAEIRRLGGGTQASDEALAAAADLWLATEDEVWERVKSWARSIITIAEEV